MSVTTPSKPGATFVPGSGGDLLLLSMRRLADLVAYCIPYEFEDLICNVTGADRVEADNQSALDLSRRVYKLARFATGSPALAHRLSPRPSTVKLQRDYELFLPVFNHTHELYTLATIPDWRKRCRYAACYISELWLHLLPRYLLEHLAAFDHIFLGVYHCVGEVAKITGRPCSYLPLAADVLRFAPAPDFPQRMIDVYNIGRRSQITHQALLRLGRERRILYCYDTVAASGFDQKQRTFRVQDASEHRMLMASMLRRSRFYITNRARVNEPEYTEGRDEISARFYEGAAAGVIMIGEPPRLQQFQLEFGWRDALIHVPFDSPDIAEVLNSLNSDPERLAAIRRENVRNAAAQHDWLHRLRVVFETFGMPPTPAMLERERQLQQLMDIPDAVWPAEPTSPHLLPTHTARLRALKRTEALVSADRPIISVVVPTHNRVEILKRALQSVAAQTFKNYEVIVVDDCSTDATATYLQSLDWPQCVVIRNVTNLGVSATRNRGVAAAVGELVTFLDDDDEFRPYALEALYERFSASPQLDFLWGGRLVHEMDAAGRNIGTREDDWSQLPDMVSGDSFLPYVLDIATNSAFTIRRKAFVDLGGFDEHLRVSEDRDLFIALARRGLVGAALPRSIIDINERYSSLSRSTGLRGGADLDLRVIGKHREFLDRPQNRAFLDQYLVTVFVGFLQAGNRGHAMRMLRELHRRRALDFGLLRKYVRHAPEFRALKSLFRYDAIRRLKNRFRQPAASGES
jgi:glycosyltransferase involved in cell wall biosynthesis